jgi:hypothetical protein
MILLLASLKIQLESTASKPCFSGCHRQIGTVRWMLMASPAVENLRHSWDQFQTTGTSDWLPGMSWHSRCKRRQLPDELLLEIALWQAENESLIKRPRRTTPATAVTALCWQLLPHSDYHVSLCPPGSYCCSLFKSKWRNVWNTFMKVTFRSSVVYAKW